MKLRTGFVTNSSSTSYLIRNLTNSMKTMLDLLKECVPDPHEWYLISWRYSDIEHDEEGNIISGRQYINGVKDDGQEIPPIVRQLYLQAVEEIRSFPPFVDIEEDFSWHMDDGYGSIRLAYGIYCSSKNFEVTDLG